MNYKMLDTREREILSMRLTGLTLEQIAENLGGLARETIRQLENRAWAKLQRQWLNDYKNKVYHANR